ncbi:MAG TPA: SDR family NAD(P)-dependent oxidoreductase [Acidimicrobiales bacterium]
MTDDTPATPATPTTPSTGATGPAADPAARRTTALVTGANKGLGLETARRLGALGWRIFVGARDRERGAAAVAGLVAGGADAHLVELDVTSDASVEAAAAHLAARTDHLDVLVNNAGIVGTRQADPLDTVPADFLACYGVNVLGPVRVTHALLPLLRRAELPRIVMVSSGMGSLTVTTDPDRLESGIVGLVYPSSKAALNMVTTMYAKALPGWKVNAADPGYTATDLNGHTGHKTVEEGAEAIVALATVGPDGPTGGFYGDTGPVPW